MFEGTLISHWLTHSYPRRAVARHAGARFIESNDVNGVMVTTVQVIPGAVGGVCGTRMGVAVLSHCYSHVGFCPITLGPADHTQVVLTVCKALYILRHTGT